MSDDTEESLLEESLLTAVELKGAFNLKGYRSEDVGGFRAFLLFAIEKAEQYSRAVYLLNQNALADESALIVRTFFEFYVTVKLLEVDPKQLSRYADFLYIMRKQKKDILRKHHLFDMKKLEKGAEKKIDQEFTRVRKEYGFKGGEAYWFSYRKGEKGPSFKQACRKIGALDLYDLVYKYLSDFSHANVMSFTHYHFVNEGGSIRLLVDRELTEGYAAMTSLFLIYICQLFNREFELGREEKLNPLIARIESLKKGLTWDL